MDYKIVTPMTLWQDFNPIKDPLEVVVGAVTSTERYVSKEMTFTVDTVADGKIRAYANVVVQKGGVAPTVLFLPTGESEIKKTTFFEMLIDRGFNVITVDYGGKSRKKAEGKYTVYPDSLAYCIYSKNRKLLSAPTEASRSPWYIWMKVVRRAITLAFEESNVDKDKLVLLGYLEGAQLAWKVSGIDGRVRALVPVCACGFTEYRNKAKYGADEVTQFSDDWDCWLAGISTQAYAKMLMAPVYLVTGTNSTYADMDRAEDLFALIPGKKKYLSFSAGTNNSINFMNFQGAVTWMEYILKNKDADILQPSLKTYVSDGKLYASVTDIKDFATVDIYYADDELNPAFRSWTLAKEKTVLNQDEVLATLLPREENTRLFVFATVTYKNGMVFSTPELYLDLTKLDLNIYDYSGRAVSRFVYTPDMKAIPFSVENYNPVVEEDILQLKTGPNGLKGLCASEGKLCTYNIEPPPAANVDFILQMEVYSTEPRDVEIVLYTAEDGTNKYKHSVHLYGTKKWQRINLVRTDFKTDNRRTLKEWTNAKKMKIRNAEGVLFNNILWI